MSLKSFKQIWKSVSWLFKKDPPFYTILSNKHKKEYWVINRDGDLVFRNSSYGECLRFIKMNTRKG